MKLLRTPEDWPVSVYYEKIYRNGGDIAWVIHKETTEFVYILGGTAKACLDGEVFRVKPGDYLVIPPGARHRFVTGKKAMTALSMFCPPMGLDKPDAVLAAGPGPLRRVPLTPPGR